MANFNKVILMGNLTRDPELRYTPNGTAVAKLGLAVNRRWRADNGENREETSFIDVDAFSKAAETMGQYLKKGQPVLIEGRLRQDSWEDKQTGQKRSKLVVVCEGFRFVGSAGAGGDAGGGDSGTTVSRPAASTSESYQQDDSSSIEDDDVPF